MGLRAQDPGKGLTLVWVGRAGTKPGNCFWGENRSGWSPKEVVEGAKDSLPVRAEAGKQ